MPEEKYNEKYNIESGEEKAWRELAGADPIAVARRSLAVYDSRSRTYAILVLGEKYVVDPALEKVANLTNPGRKPEYLLNLSTPIYMVYAKDLPVSGELVKELKGGEFFFRGSHTLPLDQVAAKYARDSALFMEAGAAMGGTAVSMGDAAFSFHVFPRVAMTFVLWVEDAEFPARASLLFDSNASRHMALDVVWSVALVSCQRMLGFGGKG
jgi:hypothetical protein